MNKLQLLSIGIIAMLAAGVTLVVLPKQNNKEEQNIFLLQSEDISHSELIEQYQNWKIKYQSSASSANGHILLGDSEATETYRMMNFKDNMNKIHQHNQQYLNGLHTFTMNLNQFSHLTPEEFEQLHLSDLSHDNEEEPLQKKYLLESSDDNNNDDDEYDNNDISASINFKEPTKLISNVTIPLWKRIFDIYFDAFKSLFSQSAEEDRPDSIDWRSKMFAPLEQGACGSCYTFATTSAIQAISGKKDKLSTQELIDCDSRNKGCKGGIPQKVYSYVSYHGITYDSKYPYMMHQRDGCGVNYEDTENRMKITTYYDVRANPDALETALKYAPVTAAIDAKSLQMYSSGIYNYECGNLRSQANHAVVIVGYTKDYFLVRNSWGQYWGENGYFKVAKDNTPHGTCGLYNDMSYPYIKSN